MGKLIRHFAFLANFLFLALNIKAQRVSDVMVIQDGQKLRIQYLLSTTTPADIKLYVSENNGATWQQISDFLSGSYGKGISSGRKEIIWDVLQSRESFVGNSFVFKVKVANVIKSVKIGNQIWMAENLNVDHYRNGDPILAGLSNDQWGETTKGACAFYKDDPYYIEIYGKLYNWYAVNDSRGLCPIGWHVPTKGEWLELEYYFGSSDLLAKNLVALERQVKENEKVSISGFDGLPSGFRSIIGVYGNHGYETGWWSSTPYPNSGLAWSLGIDFSEVKSDLDYYSGKTTGLSVRCIKD